MYHKVTVATLILSVLEFTSNRISSEFRRSDSIKIDDTLLTESSVIPRPKFLYFYRFRFPLRRRRMTSVATPRVEVNSHVKH